MQSLLNHFISPKKFMVSSQVLLPWLVLIFFLSLSYGLYGGLILAPEDAVQGQAYRILFVHAPCAFLSLFIYFVMTLASFIALVWRLKMAYKVLRYSSSSGMIFTFLALLTGSLWGKPMWGTWWLWDARLTSELILLFIYIAISFLQHALAHKSAGERMVAWFVLVGFVDLPIIHYSVYWWNTLHQGATIGIFSTSHIDATMLYPLLSMIIAFATYYAMVLFLRLRNDLLKTQWENASCLPS